MRTFGLAAVVVLALAVLVMPAYAQGGGAWHLIGASDGALYVVADGVRHRVVPLAPPDDQIESIPLGDAWGYTFGGMTPPPTTAAGGWREVARWQGRGQKTTEPVVISGQSWRIIYAGADGRQLCIEVHQLPAQRLSGQCLRQSDTTYVYSGPGTYYLNLSSLDQWTVTVEDGP